MITIMNIKDVKEYIDEAAKWFHSKWYVPEEAYRESMTKSIICKDGVPSWYLALDEERIVGGLGVIENDFHERKDLTPNVCAVYVEVAYRKQGIAGQLLQRVCDDMKERGIDTLYLITNHTSFYERYDWEFLCMVRGDEESELSRMYVHRNGDSYEKSNGKCSYEL